MADYEKSATVDAPPEAAFGYLADARNLPSYVSLMSQANPAAGGALHVAANVQGRHEEGDATFSADAAARRIDWSRAGSDYRGWLTVTADDGTARSRVTIHIHSLRDADQADIERAIEDTLANIRTAAAGM